MSILVHEEGDSAKKVDHSTHSLKHALPSSRRLRRLIRSSWLPIWPSCRHAFQQTEPWPARQKTERRSQEMVVNCYSRLLRQAKLEVCSIKLEC